MRRIGEFALLFVAFCIAGQAAVVLCNLGPSLINEHPLEFISRAALVGLAVIAGAWSWVRRRRAKRMEEQKPKAKGIALLRRSAYVTLDDLEEFWATLHSWGGSSASPYLTPGAPNKRIEQTPPRRRSSST